MTHIDEWIDSAGFPTDETEVEAYAKFFFLLKRLPVIMQMAFSEQIKPYELYCDYQGQTWRVTGASRMGDIWLTSDMQKDTGYDARVDLALCSNWRKELK